MAITTKASIASFGGKLLKLNHQSKVLGCEMVFNLYLPPQATAMSQDSEQGREKKKQKVPVLIYLSGLTCTPDNCSEKGFFQHGASKHGIAVLYPDTSPRNLTLPGQDDSYDFGSSASFYLDATQPPWSDHYKMYSYLVSELPDTIFSSTSTTTSSSPSPSSFNLSALLDSSRVSITGHSMGGHGALTLYLKNPGKYRSCSAFAPVANPLVAPWGQKAFKGYFGEDEWRNRGKEHDATELVRGWKKGEDTDLNILIDVGLSDPFYTQGQLLPENFAAAAREAGVPTVTVADTNANTNADAAADSADVPTDLKIRYHEGYDHSYYFMASFADEHVAHAARVLCV